MATSNSLEKHIPFYLFSLLFLSISINSANAVPSRLRIHDLIRKSQFEAKNTSNSSSSSSISKDFETLYYPQTLDHFSYGPESFTTFKQRYAINSKYWGGANSSAPILAFLGAEGPIDYDVGYIGFLNENAPRLKALQVYIEHRYYGKSVPFGSVKKAMKNASIRGYFNTDQAIADYAVVLLHVKKKLSAHNSPIIVVGGSYGGMLAAWFRLKYPHVAIGALASSAPILYFDDITPESGYYSVVTKDFKDTSESCYETIRKSWAEIDRVASEPSGLSILSRKFKTCGKLKTSADLKDYLDTVYCGAAQYNGPSTRPLSHLCNAIDGAPNNTDTLGKLFAGVSAYRGNRSCYNISGNNLSDQLLDGWYWQSCSEMVMPIAHGSDEDSMFPKDHFDLESYTNDCKRLYGVVPRPHWVTTYYGGHDIKLVFHEFASNIIFSNGLRDPYSRGGVLENITESVVAVTTDNGSHCLDLLSSRPSDPQWLVMQRKNEIEIIEGWIAKYRADSSNIIHDSSSNHNSSSSPRQATSFFRHSTMICAMIFVYFIC
ncbi:Lysosomal Pro-X carboxypeptidase [Morus notabilis]|uniref:Lysosomal Pro-X carboxypeptidase n=1 Tax=Morus notabilis TaxID=981085 RepID=W9RBW5_9ROSA|nr:Lysosomal Pro-X carboxypeptidase [Morus notabilis]